MILRIFNEFVGSIIDAAHDTFFAAKRQWDETPRTVVSETDRRSAKILADAAKFRYILANDLCGCPNCKQKRQEG